MLQHIPSRHFHEHDGFVSDEVDSVNDSYAEVNSIPSSRSVTPPLYSALKGSTDGCTGSSSKLIVIPGDDFSHGSTALHSNHKCFSKSDVTPCASEALRSKSGELNPEDPNLVQIAHIDYSSSPNDVWRSIQRRSSKHKRSFLAEFLSPLYHPECQQRKQPKALFSPVAICKKLLTEGSHNCPHSSFTFRFHSHFNCHKHVSVCPLVPSCSTSKLLSHESCARTGACHQPLDHVVYNPPWRKKHRIQDCHPMDGVKYKILGAQPILSDATRRKAIDDGTLETAFSLTDLSSDVHTSDYHLRNVSLKSGVFPVLHFHQSESSGDGMKGMKRKCKNKCFHSLFNDEKDSIQLKN
jgi:hypothetical protein